MKFILPITTLLAAALSGTEALRGVRKNAQSNDDAAPIAARQLNSKQLDLTIINQAFQQPFGAFFVMVHDNTTPILYRRGQPASEDLAILAEDGNPGPLVDFYRTQPGVHNVFAFNDNAPYFLGDTATISVDVPEDHFVTIASMAINTNDCFVSINRQKLNPGQVLNLPGLDAGTEENNEDCRSIPGPACSAESGNRRDGNGEGFVHVHRGFFGVGDPNDPEFLSEVGYDWRNPMLRVVVTEAAEEDLLVLPQITGLTLFDANTDLPIGNLVDGSVISLADAGRSLSVVADTSGSVGQVQFDLDGREDFRTERFAPFSLGSDIDADLHPVGALSHVGRHTVSATAFSASGEAGPTVTVTFFVEP